MSFEGLAEKGKALMAEGLGPQEVLQGLREATDQPLLALRFLVEAYGLTAMDAKKMMADCEAWKQEYMELFSTRGGYFKKLKEAVDRGDLTPDFMGPA